MFRMFEERPEPLSITEGIALLSFAYLLVTSAFNTGYFNNIPGHFVELFSLQDLFATNLAVLEYSFTVFVFYSIFSVLTFFRLPKLVSLIAGKFGSFSNFIFTDSLMLQLGMLLLILIFHLLTAAVGLTNSRSFTLVMIPSFLFHGTITYAYITAWRADLAAYRTTLWIVTLNLWVFSYISGSKWVQSEIADTKDLQSFQMKDGLCLDRKLLRSAGGGLLLYNPGLKQFEIRSRDDFKTIYPSVGCI